MNNNSILDFAVDIPSQTPQVMYKQARNIFTSFTQ
jgi:hypothetical protein